MAKIYGLFGSMTGKLADTVMAVRNGEQIARKYQPVVYNPSTTAQIAQRAKLKLMSQLSAVCAPVIAIPRKGPISARNSFTKGNFGLTSFDPLTNKASVDLDQIQLTESIVALPSIIATRSSGNINASLVAPAGGLVALDVDRIVYCLFEKQADEKLRFVSSKVVTEAGDTGVYGTSFVGDFGGGALVLAYGVRDNTEAAHVKFGNLTAPSALTVAQLVVNRTLTETDITLTETRGYLLQTPAQAVSSQENEATSRKK